MIATISKEFTFSASHQLEGLAQDHKCARLHGHNYVVRVEVEGTTDQIGFVVDYGDLAEFGHYLDDVLDHRHLNDIMVENPTAEYLARHLISILRKVVVNALPGGDHPLTIAVSISETPKTWATYRVKW